MVILTLAMLFSLPLLVFAESKTFSNSTYTNWDKPYTGTYNAYKYTTSNKNYVHADVKFKYNSTQKTNMLNTNYYPTVEIKLDSVNPKLQGLYYSTTMPDAKLDTDNCSYSTFSAICEIEAASKTPNDIVAGTEYQLSTEWQYISSYNVSTEPYLIAYSSQSREPTTAECLIGQCELNTVSNTFDSLAGFHIPSDITSGSWTATTTTLATDSIQTNTTQIESKTLIENPEYTAIENKIQLDEFAAEVNDNIRELKGNELSEFIITFNRPLSSEEVKEYLDDISSVLLYGRGINSNSERVTIGQVLLSDSVFDAIESDTSYEFKGYIQLQGVASKEVLEKLVDDSNVYSVEVAKGTIPMGLYWKLENSK
ncbi:hypothetical protein [Paenibacillus sp. NRS-1760]|uniref:hypothetical protein n=1 Tax=Paenibacillus sp. NRS-1760 TaxID=3233902 RepID=UPI003D26B529